MSIFLENLVFITIGGLAGLFGMIIFFKGKNFVDIEKKKEEAETMISKSKEEAEKIILETKEGADRFEKNLKEEIERRNGRIEKTEESHEHKNESLKRKEEKLEADTEKVRDQVKRLKELQAENRGAEERIAEKLIEKAGSSKEELKNQIIQEYVSEMAETKVDEESMKEEANTRARETIIGCLQRLTSPTSVESRAVHVKLAKDFIKGKIVGKDACNIRALEEMIDVAIVFNDLPQTISLSAFNLVERRVAQKTIGKLATVKNDIDKKTIEEKLAEARKEVDEELYEIGKKAVDAMGFSGWDKDLIRVVGRLKYRTSYGQNIMKHSMEVSWMAAMLAAEIGLDINVAKVAGFLHDVGKAIDQDPAVEDAHDRLTKEIMEKHGFSEDEVHAAWVHHEAEPARTAEAQLIKAADSISAARPGARAESIYSYSERIEALETTAKSFDGVDKVFVISAGREVRIMVDPDKIDDAKLNELARQIADKTQEDVVFPGHIKINAIRRKEYYDTASNQK